MAGFSHGHGVVIGVGTHKYATNHDVPITAVDAEDVASVLIDPQFCGYPGDQVTLLTHAQTTRDQVLGALADLAKHTTDESTVTIFFAGHGVFGEDDRYYLMTHDAQLKGKRLAADSGVSDEELLTCLRRIPARKLLLLLNACHSGEIAPVLSPDTNKTLGETLPEDIADAILATGSGRAIITACRAGQFSFVGSERQTLFTQAIIEGLQGRGTRNPRHPTAISLFDLYTHVYFSLEERVTQRVPVSVRQIYGDQQEPELTINKGVGPFPVALYRGAETLGSFDETAPPPEFPTVRQVNPMKSKMQFERLAPGTGPTIQIGRDSSGINIAGDNSGTVTQRNKS
jgi:hypothetical protein